MYFKRQSTETISKVDIIRGTKDDIIQKGIGFYFRVFGDAKKGLGSTLEFLKIRNKETGN